MYPLGCSPHRVRVPKKRHFFQFLGVNDPLTEKFQNSAPKGFSRTPIHVGSPRDVLRRPSAAPEPIAPKFLRTTFPSKYFVLAEFHPPRLSFGGVMLPTPSFASLQYGLPYSIWQAMIISSYPDKGWKLSTVRKSAVESTTLAQPFWQWEAWHGIFFLWVNTHNLTW